MILAEAGLELIGLGDSRKMGWRYMLHDGEGCVRDACWTVFFTTLAISTLVRALNAQKDL